jgi:hypothetical protein
MNWPHDDQKQLNEFFGKLTFDDGGQPTESWERAFLTKLDLPYVMRLAWKPEVLVRTIAVNQMVRKSLAQCLHDIQVKMGPAKIKEFGLDLFGGCYCFRQRRTSQSLSIHSWAAAIDLNPAANPLGKKGIMPPEVVDIFEGAGWTWGGRWKYPDPMHFEATSGKA